MRRSPLDNLSPPRDRLAVRRALDSAIAYGSEVTGIDSDEERALSCHDLMCLAGEASIDVALVAQVFKAQSQCADVVALADIHASAELLWEASAGSTRLVRKALAVHARDTGYADEIWLATAFDTASSLLRDGSDVGVHGIASMPPLYARVAARSLFEALSASISDRMAVPGYLADALGANLALFMGARAFMIAADL